MKAYELMKLAAENPQKYKGKKYSVKWGKVVDRDGDCMKAIEVDSDGQLVGACGKWAYVSCDTELEEIKPEPVPFMDAVRAYSEGKTIRCEWGGDVYRYTGDRMIDHRADAVCPDEILHGTWTIEA
jgi:hypothetical protein